MANVRVFSPRGKRGGGGLIAQLVVDEALVQRWLGPIGGASATERVVVGRIVQRDLVALGKAVTAAFEERERARRETAAPAAPGEFEPNAAVASAAHSGVVLATAGPIAQGTEGDPT